MKMIASILYMLCLLIGAHQHSAKAQKSDREFAGLKGKVRTVQYEYAELEEIEGKLVAVIRDWYSRVNYDESGAELSRESYCGGKLRNRTTYFDLDGARAAKSEELAICEGPASGRGVNTGGGSGSKLAVPTPTPDPRYDYKCVSKYDAKGNCKEKECFDNQGGRGGHFFYKYDEKGNLIEEKPRIKDGTERQVKFNTRSFSYDDEGNLVKESHANFVSEYSGFEFDAQRNWIKRSVKRSVQYGPHVKVYQTLEYRKISYY